MMTKFSKWMLYLSSYSMLYLLLLVKILGFKNLTNKTLLETWSIKFKDNMYVIIILLVLFIISVVWMNYMTSWESNTRYKRRLDKNKSIEMVGFVIPYIVSMCTIDIDVYGILLNIVLFIVLGIAFVGSEKLYFSPSFLMMGYKLYISGSNYVFCKLSIEQFNLYLEENSNGINARELCKEIYIIK